MMNIYAIKMKLIDKMAIINAKITVRKKFSTLQALIKYSKVYRDCLQS